MNNGDPKETPPTLIVASDIRRDPETSPADALGDTIKSAFGLTWDENELQTHEKQLRELLAKDGEATVLSPQNNAEAFRAADVLKAVEEMLEESHAMEQWVE